MTSPAERDALVKDGYEFIAEWRTRICNAMPAHTEVVNAMCDMAVASLTAHPSAGEPENKGMIMPHVHDLYAALGIKWGDDPFTVIQRLRNPPAPSESSPESVVVPIGWAQELANGDKLLLMQTDMPANEIHDNGRPLYRLYRAASPDAQKGEA